MFQEFAQRVLRPSLTVPGRPISEARVRSGSQSLPPFGARSRPHPVLENLSNHTRLHGDGRGQPLDTDAGSLGTSIHISGESGASASRVRQ